jgi:hypothetical protein
MPIDERWDQLNASDWDAFAQSWIAELRDTPSDSEGDVGQSVVMMNFTARPEHQWQFILAAIAHASDDELGHICCSRRRPFGGGGWKPGARSVLRGA